MQSRGFKMVYCHLLSGTGTLLTVTPVCSSTAGVIQNFTIARSVFFKVNLRQKHTKAIRKHFNI